MLQIFQQPFSFTYNLLKFYFIYVILIVCWKFCESIKNHVLAKVWKVDLKAKYGLWAVVTGCEDGIGKAYSYELAKRGINLILISSSESKLEEVSSDIRINYAVESEIIPVDFSNELVIREELEKKLRGRSIAILVNNVGAALETPRPYDCEPLKVISDHMLVDIMASTHLVNIVLPSMINNGKGAIINISSRDIFHSGIYSGIYSAPKVYNYHFSEALKCEVQEKGIFVQTVMPSFVASSINKMDMNQSLSNVFLPTPESFAADAVATIGYANNTFGCFAHDMLSIVFYILPPWMLKKGSELMYRQLVPNLNNNEEPKLFKQHSL